MSAGLWERACERGFFLIKTSDEITVDSHAAVINHREKCLVPSLWLPNGSSPWPASQPGAGMMPPAGLAQVPAGLCVCAKSYASLSPGRAHRPSAGRDLPVSSPTGPSCHPCPPAPSNCPSSLHPHNCVISKIARKWHHVECNLRGFFPSGQLSSAPSKACWSTVHSF